MDEMDELKKCPLCGIDLVHPVGVYVQVEGQTGAMLHAITADGYTCRPVDFEEPANTRGVVIIREFLGECGHRWIETEQFHKGSTLQDWQQLNALVGPLSVIWRD